jgi:ABC-type Fe3+/spermidine/putrescine transport system ATPase subunit
MANDACFRHCTGKTTLLQLIAGKYMVDKKTIVVLGQSPFHDLVCIKLYA